MSIFFPTSFAGIWTQRLLLPSPTRYHYATFVEGRLVQNLYSYETLIIVKSHIMKQKADFQEGILKA